jgi:hypothetical protein
MSVLLKTIPDYRNAFAEFAQKLRQARALMAATNPDWQAIDAALLNLEKARLNYNHQRDILAQELLVSSKLPAFQPPASDSVQPESNRVRAIAELRWELAGKPDGRDDDNWYRAEEILRRATAA